MRHPQQYADLLPDGSERFPVESQPEPWAEAKCAICCGPFFTEEEWDARHDGYDPLTDVHAPCCRLSGCCSDPARGHEPIDQEDD